MARDAKAPPRREELWEQALERAQLGVWDWNLETDETFYSATWARMLGYEPEELPHASDLWVKLTHPDDREAAIASGDRHIAGLTDIIETEMRFRHKDGRWVWVLDRGGVVERDDAGRPLRMIGVQTDITKQKAAEAALGEVNARFRLALAASGTGIWHHDFDVKASFWDERTREIYGVPAHPAAIPSDLWSGFLHPDDRASAEEAHNAAIGSSAVSAVRYRIVRRDGEVRHIESLLRFSAKPGSAGQLLGTVRDVTEEERRAQDLAYAARHDALTGLLNRAAFDALLAESIQGVHGHPLAVFYVDLDYFKALNDFAGHAAGDAALKGVAAAIRGSLPPKARAARLGGDEFAVLVPDCSSGEVERLAGLLLERIGSADLGPSAGPRRLAASIGAALVDDPSTQPADALACADDACYAAKASGRNRFSLFSGRPAASASGPTSGPMSGMTSGMTSTMTPGLTSGLNAARVAADTVDALEEGRLKLFAQEIRPLDRPWEPGSRAEVLARLTGRNGEPVSPAEFIPAAERFGMAPRLDRWIFRTALTRFGNALGDADGGPGSLALNFNLSAQTLSDPGLWDFVDATIAETGVPHAAIVFEITETAAVTSFEAAERFVRNARERACSVSLDDFGAGLSSFDYLRRFPVDSIKINGSFVENMTANRFDREIVSALNGIARSLGLSVVAEKIETREALEALQAMGVTFGQGFLLHRPEPLEAVVARLGASDADPAATATRRPRKLNPRSARRAL